MLASGETLVIDDDEGERMRIELRTLLREAISPSIAPITALGVDIDALVAATVADVAEDLWALVGRDPASNGSWEYVLTSYSCFHAVAAYRVAHGIVELVTDRTEDRLTILALARKVSESAKVRTGVEIHPAATIGPRFVIDHGMGTVIGEDVRIGADCYLLQGVVLGALGIADNKNGRRHPWLGDRVQVGGFARVLGPVSIGDGVTIGSHALVCSDVPAGGQVSVLHQYQMVCGPRPITVYGIETLGQFRYRLHGIDLDRPGLEMCLVGPTQAESPGRIVVLHRTAKYITFQLPPKANGRRSVTHIRIRNDGSEITIGIPVGKQDKSRSLRLSA
jgi:serine O-acetyltransferase